MNIKEVEAVSQSIRALSADAIERSKSGHPGLPLGCADIGAVLFSKHLRLYPKKSSWINRDRFVLSAGHGSMLLYSLLHLSGFNITLDDLKDFRSIDSKTPGHPEYGHTDGIEGTTGPLGAGISYAVGMAISESYLSEKFNRPEYKIIDNYTYVLAGDGCLMEGISYEAASLAGHLELGKLILIYDSNNITIEGSTSISTSEDILKRFESFGWQTLEGDGHNLNEIDRLITKAKEEKKRPTIIKFNTVIGFGSPNLEGTSKIHGSPLGKDEIKRFRERLNIPDIDFYINPLAINLFKNRSSEWKKNYNRWQTDFKSWAMENPKLNEEWNRHFSESYHFSNVDFPKFNIGDNLPTRVTSGAVLNSLANFFPGLIGGSGDLTPSTNTALIDLKEFSKSNRLGRNIHFGIREHAMGGIINGINLYGGLRAFCSTFLVFSDYLRPALRLAALMKLNSIFIFTHDSVFLGKDGPTHQPVEHIESLRAIPNLLLLRPGDGEESVESWKIALNNKSGPTAIILSRQNLKVFKKEDILWKENYKKGAYIVKDSICPEIVILATGSEVNLALEAVNRSDKEIRVISVTSRKNLIDMGKGFIESLIPENTRVITVEAGINSGWLGFVKNWEDAIGIDSFGYSGDSEDIANKLNFNINRILERINC